MKTILLLVFLCLPLAWHSEQYTAQARRSHGGDALRGDWAFWTLCLVLTLFAGLRTQYNDTWNYLEGFRKSGGLADYVFDPKNWELLGNPLFYFLEACLRQFTQEGQWLIFLTSAFSQVSFLLFFRRYSTSFTFTVFLYFTLGTFNLSLAAIKQVLAMALLVQAMPALERRQWLRYGLLVVVAALIHTYAIAFLALPLFRQRPWTVFTFLFVGAAMFVLVNFYTVIEEFLEYANNLGKNLAEYEVLDDHTVNLFRVAVYAVPPVLSLLFVRWVNYNAVPMENVFVHMSIISLAFMSMGTQAGANMFARMAHYFELGTLVCLPAMLDRIFEKSTYRAVATLAVLGFTGFFLYANRDFDAAYQGLGILGWF